MAKINTLNYQTVASWNGSQDLFVVEQPDGTKVATPEQVKQYVLGDMDEVPTQDSENPVMSGGVFSTMAVPKYDAANRREYYEGGSAFSGNIDSSPTAGSNNAVASGGTKTYVDNAVSGLIKVVYFTGTTSANGNIQFTGLPKANTIVLGCQISGTADNACIVAIPYIYSALNSGNWGAHCLLESGTYAIAANMAIKGYVYYIEKQAYTN